MTQENDNTEAPASIRANFDNTVDIRTVAYHFRKDELGNKRASVELQLPVPSVEGLIAILEGGGKPLDLLLEAAADIVISQAKSIVDGKEDINQENFPMDLIGWDYIANLPPRERRGGGIPKEIWDAFSKDYIEVMPAVTGKTLEQVGAAAKLLVTKFSTVKTNKPVLGFLKEQLALYITHSPNAEDYAACVDFLQQKADQLIAADEAALLAAL